MPIFEYQCDHCGRRVESSERFEDGAEGCGEGNLEFECGGRLRRIYSFRPRPASLSWARQQSPPRPPTPSA